MISVSPDGALTAGGTATVSLSNAPPNTTVTVTIDNGGSPAVQDTIQVEIDGNGNGSGTWSVRSDWDLARFNALEFETVSRFIVSS